VIADQVRIAVVGLGYWGPNLVRNLHELPEAEVAWICDRRPETFERVRRRYPTIPATTQLGRVLDDPDVDAVEKPLAASSEEAVALARLADEQSLVLMPGHTFLYSPPVNKIRDLISSGELGEIYSISMSRVNLGLHQPDVSVVWDLGPHDFSILRYWLGEVPSQVAALSRGCILPDIPDLAFVNLQFPSQTIASVELSWLAPSKLRRTTIIGSNKMVVYDDTSVEPVRIFDSGVMLPDPETFGEYKLIYRTGDIVSPRIEAAEPLHLEMQDFCSAILGDTVPRSSAQIGIDVIQIIEAADLSLAQSGLPVGTATSDTAA
jgi:predicted dehydrogenase